MTGENDSTEYDSMLLLDRLESLLEDMDELRIATRDELQAKIAALHRQLDDLEVDS